MGWVLLIVVLGVLIVALVALERVIPKGEGKKPVALEYEACGTLLTEAEAAFYPVLVEAVKAGARTCRAPLRESMRFTD